VARVLEVTEDCAVVEREHGPGTGKTDRHVHLDFDQTFEVVEGTVRLQIGDEAERDVSAGETIRAPRGVAHRDPYNLGPGRARWRNSVSPVPRFVHIYFGSYGELLAADRLNAQEEFSFLQLMSVLRAGRSQSFATGPPIAVQKVLIPIAAALARARGIRPTVD